MDGERTRARSQGAPLSRALAAAVARRDVAPSNPYHLADLPVSQPRGPRTGDVKQAGRKLAETPASSYGAARVVYLPPLPPVSRNGQAPRHAPPATDALSLPELVPHPPRTPQPAPPATDALSLPELVPHPPRTPQPAPHPRPHSAAQPEEAPTEMREEL